MKKFKKVHFRIITPSYYNKAGVGFQDKSDRIKFEESALKLFLDNGWKPKKGRFSGSSDRVTKDKQELYLHPQSFSGVVLEENIKNIETISKECELFKFKNTDVYDDVFDMTDQEYLNLLESKKSEIEKDILEKYKTKRRNLYITDLNTPIMKVLDKYSIKRIKKYLGMTSDDVDYVFMTDVFKKLVNEGKIVSENCRNGMGYRTINKTEQKESKISL